MVLNFCMWFKNGLKAQKLLAQGIALGIMANSKAPCKGKSFIITKYLKLLPLQGVWGKLGEVLFLFLLQLTLLNQMIQSEDFGILLFK